MFYWALTIFTSLFTYLFKPNAVKTHLTKKEEKKQIHISVLKFEINTNMLKKKKENGIDKYNYLYIYMPIILRKL